MQIVTINIKEDYPPADVAVAMLEMEIESYKSSDVGVLKVIHGYGSHGVGGEIKRQLSKRLLELKSKGKIFDYILGEKFGEEQKKSDLIVKHFPSLLIDADLRFYNSGITLVFLNSCKNLV